jgi:hypothetical protein
MNFERSMYAEMVKLGTDMASPAVAILGGSSKVRSGADARPRGMSRMPRQEVT